jgi:hypothetical protein
MRDSCRTSRAAIGDFGRRDRVGSDFRFCGPFEIAGRSTETMDKDLEQMLRLKLFSVTLSRWKWPYGVVAAKEVTCTIPIVFAATGKI